MFGPIQNGRLQHIRGATMRGVILSLALALMLALGANHGETPQADAADPDLEFEMEVSGGIPSGGGGCTTVGTAPTQKGDAVCSVLVNGSFTVTVRLADAGAFAGQHNGVQSVIGWTSGLIGRSVPWPHSTTASKAARCCTSEDSFGRRGVFPRSESPNGTAPSGPRQATALPALFRH